LEIFVRHQFVALSMIGVLSAGLGGCAPGPHVQTRATEQGLKLTFGPTFFDYKSAMLGEAGHLEVERIARLLRQKPRALVTIEGHTDDIGSASYNLVLSKARAETVRNALIEKGVDRDRLDVLAMGEMSPVAYNLSEDGRAQNRRVEVIIR
jgi:outer membrane protein OmpA-like peptidoglycan-associated protein